MFVSCAYHVHNIFDLRKENEQVVKPVASFSVCLEIELRMVPPVSEIACLLHEECHFSPAIDTLRGQSSHEVAKPPRLMPEPLTLVGSH